MYPTGLKRRIDIVNHYSHSNNILQYAYSNIIFILSDLINIQNGNVFTKHIRNLHILPC